MTNKADGVSESAIVDIEVRSPRFPAAVLAAKAALNACLGAGFIFAYDTISSTQPHGGETGKFALGVVLSCGGFFGHDVLDYIEARRAYEN